ncbi:MAG: deoxyhypusine synthase [Desulfurococcaceae archaeon]
MGSELFEATRNQVLQEEVLDFTIGDDMSLCELIESYGKSHGFMASHIYKASKILSNMIRDQDATRILSFTGNIVSTGLRGVIAQLIREGIFHAVITTCGTIDHDIARGSGYKYYRGDWTYDDTMLHAIGIHRLGNILIPTENYGLAVEKFARGLLEDLAKVKKKWSAWEVLYEAGRRIKDNNSILSASYERKVPVFVPGIYDGAFGSQIVFNFHSYGVDIDLLSDERKIMELVVSSKKLGALIIGGGISKHHTIWWAQLKGGLDYAIYITTAVEYDGSLSGAHPREAITWGKVKPDSKHILVHGDATVVLPLVVAGSKCMLRMTS